MFIPTHIMEMIASKDVSIRYGFMTFPKNRSTNNTTNLNAWTGLNDVTVNISGVNRLFRGAGGLIQIPAFVYSAGTNIRNQTITLSAIDEINQLAILENDLSMSRIEIHMFILDNITGAISATVSMFTGYVDRIEKKDSSEPVFELSLVSDSRSGTRTLTTKKSDASQKLRDPDDDGFIYSDVTGTGIQIFWGTEKHKQQNTSSIDRLASGAFYLSNRKK